MARRRTALVMAALFAVLLAHNLVLLVRNQLVFDRNHRFAQQHARLEDIAAEANHPDVHGEVSLLYLLERRLAGTSVRVPPSLIKLAWWLERSARLHVEISAVPLPLAEGSAAALLSEAPATGMWRLRSGRPFHVLVVDGETHYVIAEVVRHGPFILLPEARYRQVAPARTRRALGWP